jgi:hypothetical protein
MRRQPERTAVAIASAIVSAIAKAAAKASALPSFHQDRCMALKRAHRLIAFTPRS